MSEQNPVVRGVHIFPIKSCREATINGEPPQSLEVGLTGFRAGLVQDRGMVIADADMLFASQRGWDNLETQHKGFPKDARLATVAVDVRPDHLALTAVGFGTLEVSSLPPLRLSERVTIFGKPFFGRNMGSESSAFFSRLLEREVCLFQFDPNFPRLINNQAYHRPDAVNVAAGADGFPFLLTSQDSLNWAHQQAGLEPGTLPLDAYRANIEVVGLEPWAEDRLRKIRIGNFSGYVLKACARCPIPNQDQQTGKPHNLSNKLLRKSRTGWRADQDPTTENSGIYMGQNINHRRDSIGAVVSVGAPLHVEEWGEPNFIAKPPKE